jgi:hypothetical protein
MVKQKQDLDKVIKTSDLEVATPVEYPSTNYTSAETSKFTDFKDLYYQKTILL